MTKVEIVLHALAQAASERFDLAPGAGSEHAGDLPFLLPSLTE